MAASDVVDLSTIPADRVFIVASISVDDAVSVIEEEGYHFVIKQHKLKHGKNKQYCPRDTRRVISRILTLKAKDAIVSPKRVESGRDGGAALAQRLLTIALRYDDKNIDAINLYGKILRAANYLEHSIDMYGRCLAVDPINVEALVSRANIYYLQLDKRHEAEWHLKIAIKFYPKNLYVLNAYAGFLSNIKNDLINAQKYYKIAIDILEETKKIGKKIADNSNNNTNNGSTTKGNDKNKNNENNENETIELYTEPHILYNYALFLAQQKQEFEKSLVYLKKYLKMRPQDTDASTLCQEIESKMNN